MEQLKIYSQQLVAEVLSQMRNMEAGSLPVYDKGLFVGKVSYEELMAFVDRKERSGNIYTHKLNFDVGTALFAIKRMRADLENRKIRRSTFHRQLFIGLSSAAAVAFLLSMAWLFFKHDLAPADTKANLVDVSSDKIMLEFANGAHVALNEVKTGLVVNGQHLNYSDGSRIIHKNTLNNTPGQSMVLNVPRKGMYKVVLQDGSIVWLNSSSSLKFPATFEGATTRRVELSGEAYFEIAKVMLKSQGISKRKMPFFVVTDKQEIEVLGTHFNVSAYRNEKSVKTTLVEGSVKLRPAIQNDKILDVMVMDPASLDPTATKNGKRAYGNAVLLKPNEEATLTGGNIDVKDVDADEAFAWTNGEYVFRNMPLENIMRMITRWYDFEVVYKDKKLGETLLGGAISKSSKINNVLEMLELSANVHFKIDGKRITVIE